MINDRGTAAAPSGFCNNYPQPTQRAMKGKKRRTLSSENTPMPQQDNGSCMPGRLTATAAFIGYSWIGTAQAASSTRPLPWSLRGVRESLRTTAEGQEWTLWLFAGLAAAFVITLIVAHYRSAGRDIAKQSNDPKVLWRTLLDQLALKQDDKRFLMRMAAGARLRHPAMCLLSPGVLQWAGQVWFAEKGPAALTDQDIQRLDDIAVQLFDYHGPDEATHLIESIIQYEDRARHQ